MNKTFALHFTLALAGGAAPAAAQISFHPATTHVLQGQRPSGVAVLDIDGDGDRDFAVTSGQLQGVNGPEWVEVFANNGAGAFSAGQVLQVGVNVGLGAIAAGDMDGDGDLDLVVALENVNAVRVLVNTAGVFSLGSLANLTGDEPKHLALGDVDGDGDLDVVTSNRSSNNLQIVTNTAGVLSTGALLAVGSRPKELVLRDLNGDGRVDIAVAAQDSRRVDLLFGSGGGAFGPLQSVAMPFNDKPSGMAAGDLDGDGDLDLATTLENNGVGYAVALRNSGGAFTATAYPTNSANPGAIAIADLDVDGDLDLALADEDSNVVSTLANLGLGTFGPAAVFAVGAYPTALAVGDLDGNGSNDLVTANRDASTVSVLRNALAGGPLTYCTSGVSVAGCQPTISASANPVVSHSSPCQITVSGMDGQRSGVLFYGLVALPQQWCGPGVGTSFLCVKAPTLRLLQQGTSGTAGGCDGALALDWNAFQLAQPTALGAPWTAGSKAYVQGWYRDPLSCKTTALSNAVQLTYQP
jgi:hypothetical protein